MIRIPDWLYHRLERLVNAETRRRRQETQRRADQYEADFRRRMANMRAQHQAGACGGRIAGCPYVPCIPYVNGGVRDASDT